jgi:hypothetical protein
MAKFLSQLKASRHYTFLYVSVWKIACFFLTMLLVTRIQYNDGTVQNLFTQFDKSFSERDIEVQAVCTMFTDIREKILSLKVQQYP